MAAPQCIQATEAINEKKLKGTCFEEADLKRANLKGAALNKVSFDLADLSEANLENASLRSSSFVFAKLRKANLKRVNLKHAQLPFAELQGANLEGALLSFAFLVGANLEGANLANTNLFKADLYNANLKGANLTGADLIGVTISKEQLADANYTVNGTPITSFYDKDLIKKVADCVVNKGYELNMQTWHSCNTVHCIGGWGIVLHPKGKELEAAIGTTLAAKILLGEEAAGYFYSSHDKALDYLRSVLSN